MNCVRPLRACALFALTSSLTVGVANASGNTPDPKIELGADTARVRRNHFFPWHPAGRNAVLPPEAELECDHRCRVRAPDGTVITLDAGASLTIGQRTYVPPRDGALAGLGWRFELRHGAIEVAVPPDSTRPRIAMIGTPQGATIVVRPGVVRAAVSGPTSVMCMGGTARVKRGAETLDLQPSQGLVIDADSEPLSARPLAAAPPWRQRRENRDEATPLGLSLNGADGRVGVAWEKGTTAASYRLEFADDATFAKPLHVVSLPSSRTFYVSRPLPPGYYYARLRAVDGRGLESLPSAPSLLRIVGVRGPATSSTNGGSWTLAVPPNATLELDDTEGLEIALDDHGFRPAAQILATDFDSHTIHLRSSGELSAQASFRIVPRALRAAIQLGPAWAFWPDHTIEVSARIEDPSGITDPASVTPQFQVLLGVEPIPVEWIRDGDLYRARIPPRDGDQPVVLRVTATDQTGAFLGRGLLEVERRRPQPIVPHLDRTAATPRVQPEQ